MKNLSIEGKSQWFDPSGIKRDATKDVVACQQCGNEWFELVLVQQYPKHQQVILGQKPAPVNDIGYWIHRCVRCNELYQPMVHSGPRDSARKEYNKFLEQFDREIVRPENGEDV